ncbi:hypothetical protein V2W30_34060 [Streptomyces sp. Q6]|uniref:Uncharacterized protein n=1 Tax=Streptomyces citrinus TaxID=3118173 RepID=A0ACD5AKW4_9ACTN
MPLVPWDVHHKAGQLVVLVAVLATALVTSTRRRLRPRPVATAAPPPPSPRLTPPVVPCHTITADAPHAEAVADLCTCVSELASDLAKRFGGEAGER